MAASSKAKSSRGNAGSKSSTKGSRGNVSSTKSERNSNPEKKPTRSAPITPTATTDAPKKRKAKQAPTPQADPVGARMAIDIPLAPGAVGFGKHRGKAWRDVPRDYLEWMVANGHSAIADASTELARRDAGPIVNVVLTSSAIDEASLKLFEYWQATRGTWEGFYAWLDKLAKGAIASVSDPATHPTIVYREIEFVFSYHAKTGFAASAQLDMIRNPKAGIAWKPSTRAGMDRAAYADRQRVKGVGVW